APAPVSTLSCASGAAEATRGNFVISGLCGLGLFGDHVQVQLAAAVDLGQFDLDLLAHREYVLDAVDPLAADQLAHLGDVQEPVLAGGQGNEGTEGHGLDDRSDEPLPHLGHLRVGDAVDGSTRRVGGGPVGGVDVDGAVVLDGDVGAGVLLDLVDHLALGADDLTDLGHRDLHGQHARGSGRHLVRGVDGRGHHVQDVQSRLAGL